jgi:restriction endonuclease S subunit
LAETGDYNLSSDRYREVTRIGKQKYPMVKLGDVCETTSGGTPLRSKSEYYENGTIPWIKSGEVAQGLITNAEEKITELGLENSSAKKFPVNTVLVAMYGATIGQVGLLKIEATTNQAICGVLPNDKFIPDFLYLILKSQTNYLVSLGSGGAQPNISQAIIRNLQIPLPPLEIQRQLVDEIAAHQHIIDGARQVVEGWKPNLELDFDDKWEMAKLDDLCEIVRGSSPRPKSNPKFYGGDVPRLMVADVTRDGMYVTPSIDTLTEEGAKQSRPMKKGDLIMAVSGQPGLCGILTIDACIHDGFAGFRNLNQEKILTEFAYHYLMSQREANNSQSVGAIFKNLNLDQLRQLEIPLPPLEIQHEIVSRIERERLIIEGNRELIKLYEEKVKKVIERVWEE